ncbi:MAG TPA: amidohydrolase family protein [Solirubrobacteraceae bacterium]|nr:amidohydrolase family protein [Solirubrobacteraceae bacterium]
MIFDAHLHLWDPAHRHHDWLAEHPPLQRRFGPQDLDVGRHDLVGAVVVQADCRDEEALDEVRWIAGLAAEHPLVRGIVAYAPLHLGRDASAALEAVAAEPLVVGIRRLLQGEPPGVLRALELVEGIRLLEAFGLPFDICVTHDQLPAVADVVAACPDVSFILDHLGKPPVAAGALDPWRDDLARIALHRNVTCKLSGLTTEAGPGWHPAALRPYLDHALDVFGPARCLVGSDWPVITLTATVESWFDVVMSALEVCTDAERAAVLSGNAHVYRVTTRGNHAGSDLRR